VKIIAKQFPHGEGKPTANQLIWVLFGVFWEKTPNANDPQQDSFCVSIGHVSSKSISVF